MKYTESRTPQLLVKGAKTGRSIGAMARHVSGKYFSAENIAYHLKNYRLFSDPEKIT